MFLKIIRKKLKLMKYKDKTNHGLKDTVAHGAGSLINKKIYNKLGGYNIRFDRQDGYFLWLALSLNNYKIIHCNQPLFFYRKHNKSLSINILKLLKSRLKIINFFSKKKNKNYKNLLLDKKRNYNKNQKTYMNYFYNLKKKIQNNKAVICIVGLGYVGSAIIEKFNKKASKQLE